MIDTPSSRLARALAMGIPALLLGGAYISQYGFGLYPCEMCMWQRYPHFAAVGLAFLAFFIAPQRLWVAFAGIAILASGAIGAYHAGVEYGWWQGATACSGAAVASGRDPMEAVLSTPLVRCDRAPWDLFGISLAGWNFLISLAAGIGIFWLLAKRTRA